MMFCIHRKARSRRPQFNRQRESADTGGNPGEEEPREAECKIGVPSFDANLKQSQLPGIIGSLQRAEYFKQDVRLQITAFSGISVAPTRVLVKASDAPDLQLQIAAPNRRLPGDT